MTPHSYKEYPLGIVVIHADGEPGVIVGRGSNAWTIAFASGSLCQFPFESASDKDNFFWFPQSPKDFYVRNVDELGLKQSRLSRIFSLVSKGLFVESQKQWEAENCSLWFPQTALDALIRKREEELAKPIRMKIESRIRNLLENLEVESATQLYKASSCSSWWRVAEFNLLKKKALKKKDFVAAYQTSSLSELDAHFAQANNLNLSVEDYIRLKLPKLKLRFARLGLPLDEEQLLACARPEQHRLIHARAGSGKTRTLAALAALNIHDEALDPDRVLILAFNKKAANEIGERVRGAAGIDQFRNARTFHSLAWQLADHAGRDLIFDDGNLAPSRRKQTGFMERLMASIMNPAFREQLYDFFRLELEQLDRLGSNLSREEYLDFRRSMTDYTLNGETVKSNGEKFIADFLFEHDISYQYERAWSWEWRDRLKGTVYKPDFSIIAGGKDFILEHWAVDPSDPRASVPEWWETTTHEYLSQINDKREFWLSRGVTLLETHAGMLRGGREALEAQLKSLLEEAGIRCQKLSRNELVQRVAEAPRNVSRLAELFLQFISRAKKRGWTVEDISQIVLDAPDPEPRSRVFHALAVHAFAAYERQLKAQSAMDFDDLGSTPILRTLSKEPILAKRSVHVEEKEVQPRVQTRGC